MKRKWLAVGIILLFVGAGIVPSAAAPLSTITRPVPLGKFFGLISHVEISWPANQTKEPLVPRGGSRNVNLQMKYWVTWGVFGRLINFFLRYYPAKMKLSVIDTPDWCAANIAIKTIQFVIPPKQNTYEILSDILTVYVGEGAPALEFFPVTIQATIEPRYGHFGFIPMMQGTTETENVTFTVAYWPLLYLRLPEGNTIETPPYVQVELPIEIGNLGNGKTIVENEVESFPEGWIVSMPAQLVLEVNEFKEMNLSIISTYNFSNEETIRISFTPHSYENYSLVGTTYYVTILAYYHPP